MLRSHVMRRCVEGRQNAVKTCRYTSTTFFFLVYSTACDFIFTVSNILLKVASNSDHTFLDLQLTAILNLNLIFNVLFCSTNLHNRDDRNVLVFSLEA